MISYGIALPFILLIAQYWKKLGLRSELVPLVNIVVATILTVVFLDGTTVNQRLLDGIVLGLSASGLYDVAKCFHIKK